MIPLWADLKRGDFESLPDPNVAVLPLGATEQHGPHLPFGVDTTLVEAVLAKVDTKCSALQLPTLSITKSGEHARHGGTLSLSAETILAVLRDICAAVTQAGVDRLVFFNGHGGNTALLEIAAREARITQGLICAHTSWFSFCDYSEFDTGALAYDLHAGDIETSAMLAAHPDLVDMGKARDFPTAMQHWEQSGHRTGLTGQPARPGWIIDDLNPDGALGNASAATASKGQDLIDSAAVGFARWLEDFANFDLAGRT